MTDDRLWSRPSTLTDEERTRAREAYEAAPASLDAPVYAALGRYDDDAARMIEIVRGTRPCADSC